ncbi:MAG: BrnA antitoxin family protein [Chloroflexota bacterium]|nr:BrnA antitoxin family protein [Chloroflexota bacterium]
MRRSRSRFRASVAVWASNAFPRLVQVGIPGPKQQLTVRFDADVVEWFKVQGAAQPAVLNRSHRHARTAPVVVRKDVLDRVYRGSQQPPLALLGTLYPS